jgi:hypothetical protein
VDVGDGSEERKDLRKRQTVEGLNTREELTPLTFLQNQITQVDNIKCIVLGVLVNFCTNQFFNIKSISNEFNVFKSDRGWISDCWQPVKHHEVVKESSFETKKS